MRRDRIGGLALAAPSARRNAAYARRPARTAEVFGV